MSLSVNFEVLTNVGGNDSALQLFSTDYSRWKTVFGDYYRFSVSDVGNSELGFRVVVWLGDVLGCHRLTVLNLLFWFLLVLWGLRDLVI